MPRESYKEHKPYAELLIAALLCQATIRDFPGHPEWEAFTASENRIHVKASPLALSALVEYYSQRSDFPANRNALRRFQKLRHRQSDVLRDTLTDMSQQRLGLTDEPKRSRSSPKTRDFCLTLPYPCSEVKRNLDWIFSRNGHWDRLVQRDSSTSKGDPEIHKTQLALENWLDRAACHFPDDLSEFTPSQLRGIALFIPHIRIALEESSSIDRKLEPKLALTLGKFYLTDGKPELARPLFERCLGLGDLAEINGLHYLGVFYSKTENYTEAEKHSLEALRLRCQRFPGQYLNVSATHHNLALIYIQQRQYHSASHHLSQALKLRENDPLLQAHSLQLQGEFLQLQSQPLEAQSSYEKALDLVGNLHEDKAILVAECKRGLARLQAKARNYPQARTLWEEALYVLDSSSNIEHPLTSVVKADLAAVSILMGDFGEAEKLYRESLSYAEKAHGDHHSIVIGIRQDYEFLRAIRQRMVAQADPPAPSTDQTPADDADH